jgi:hypothetical protein
MAKTLYHRLAEQITAFSTEAAPPFVNDVFDRLQQAGEPTNGAPQTHVQRMAQSDRGHANPGPGKAKRMYGKRAQGPNT